MKKGHPITELKTGRKGTFIALPKRKLSIDLWVVQWEGDTHQSQISASLTLEGQWNYHPRSKTLLPVEK